MIKHVWMIGVIITVGLMLSALATTIDLDGQCTTQHNCYLVNELGMTEYLQYIGFTNEWTMYLIALAIIPIIIGTIAENFREARHEKQI